MNFPVLSLLTFLPLAAGLALLCARPAQLARGVAAAVVALELLLGLLVWAGIPADGGFAFVERFAWMPSIGVEYHLGVDGVGLVFLLLTVVVFPMACLVSWNAARPSSYWALLLLLQGGLMGTFTALNFVHWFFYWEISLIPAFFLVRQGGDRRSAAAATQFFIYTMAGSIAMLAGFLGLYQATGSFDLPALAEGATTAELSPGPFADLIFFLVLAGLAVKLPLVPFHGWLAPTYTSAATPVTMLLTGVMSKMGVYGLVRLVAPIFPEQIAAWQNVLLLVAVGTVIYSAFAALAQEELKHLLAYSSINHLAYCALGVFALGGEASDSAFAQAAALNGVLLQVFSHGLLAAGLFAFAEFLARRQPGPVMLDRFGGLRRPAPAFAGLMGIVLFASLGLPGLSGFVAEFLIFQGTFALHPWAAGISVIGLLITAIFLLTVIQKIFSGPVGPHLASASDLGGLEKAAVLPAIGLSFLVGIFPAVLGSFINPAVVRIVEQLKL